MFMDAPEPCRLTLVREETFWVEAREGKKQDTAIRWNKKNLWRLMHSMMGTITDRPQVSPLKEKGTLLRWWLCHACIMAMVNPFCVPEDIILYTSNVYISIRYRSWCCDDAELSWMWYHSPGSRPSSCARLEREENQHKKIKTFGAMFFS